MENMEAKALSQAYREKIEQLNTEMGKVVVGQHYMISRLMVGLLCGGHVLLEGMPGLAKTLAVNTLSRVLDLSFQRLQFTPDLLPADLVGTMIYNPQKAIFEVKKGPIFANLILADEINRSPAKVQSALLEAMQEKQVSIGDKTYAIERPFLVLATQNPVEQEGTYPLPEAQVDRFMMKIEVDYPSKEEEMEIMKRMSDTAFDEHQVKTLFRKKDIFSMREELNRISVSDSLERYIVELVFATREPKKHHLDDFAKYIQYGVSPRASIHLHLGARALAFLEGREYVLPEDVKDIAKDVLNHRIILHYEAEAENIRSQDIISEMLNRVPIRK